jgi:predicted nucleic acid-binding protein
MIVVADSSPFVVLVAIGHVDVLPALFKEVLIPPEVESELASPRRPQAVRDLVAAPPSWLRVQSPALVEPIEGLHAGEAAAIALARELRADRVIIDEALGRRIAAERGLRVVGTIGVLEAAAERGFIDLGHASEEVKKTDFWVSPTFLDERLARFLGRRPDQESTESKSLPRGSDGG